MNLGSAQTSLSLFVVSLNKLLQIEKRVTLTNYPKNNIERKNTALIPIDRLVTIFCVRLVC